MKSTIVASGLALVLGMATAIAQTTPPSSSTTPGAQPKMQMTQAQCESLWTKMNPSGGANVSQSAATPYVTTFSQVDTNSDGQLSSAEFMSGCQKGLVMDSATTGSGTGSTGGSSGSSTGGSMKK